MIEFSKKVSVPSSTSKQLGALEIEQIVKTSQAKACTNNQKYWRAQRHAKSSYQSKCSRVAPYCFVLTESGSQRNFLRRYKKHRSSELDF